MAMELWIISAVQEACSIPLDDCVYPPSALHEGQERKIGQMTPSLLQLFTYLFRLHRIVADLSLQLNTSELPHQPVEVQKKLSEALVRSKAFEAVFWSEVCVAVDVWGEPLGVRSGGEIVQVPRTPVSTVLHFGFQFPYAS